MVKMTESSRVADYIAESSEANWITPLGIPNSFDKLVNFRGGGQIGILGGGTGSLGRKIAEEEPESEIVTTDLSPEAVKVASNHPDSYRNHHVVQADGLSSFKDSYFSQIYAVNVLQAMDNPEEGLREIFDKLEEGGTTVVTVPGEESANIFPEQAQFYDEDLNLPYIEVPAEVKGNEVTYSQYILTEDWMNQVSSDLGLDVKEGHPEKILSDPTGMPKISEICEEEYSPNIPSSALYALEKAPSDLVRKAVEYTGLGPEVDLWIMEK